MEQQLLSVAAQEASMAAELIVVVEDDVDTLEFMEDLLTLEGYHVIGVPTAQHAHGVIQREQPVVVVIDLHFDGQATGWTLIEQLRADPTTVGIPAILYSGGDTFLHARQADLRALDCDTLVKPFQPHELLAKLTAARERATDR